MLSFTVRLPERKKFLLWSGFLIGALIICGFIAQGSGTTDHCDTPQAQRDYAASYGWKIGDEPISVTEFTIADQFDKALEQYNEIQLSQGFDLRLLKGQTVRRYTYELLNYPSRKTGVRLSLVIADGAVVGGDISSVDGDGFMHGFDLNGTNLSLMRNRLTDCTQISTFDTSQQQLSSFFV